MKALFSTLFFLSFTYLVSGQDEAFNVYDINVNAVEQINQAVQKADAGNKHVFLQIGGNWCKWCKMFYKFSTSNKSIDSLFNADYVVVHINFSKENKNPEAMKLLDYPQRFGFPVFVILDEKGKRLHTQNTGYLEDGEGYSVKKVSEFLNQWNRNALQGDNYNDK